MDRAKWRMWTSEQTLRHDRCGAFEWEVDPKHPDWTGARWEAGWWECEACRLMDKEAEDHAKKVQAIKMDAPMWGRSVRLFRKVTGGV